MNLSQFFNISLFSKPAARHTNKDSLLYSTTSTSGGRFASGASAGITLIEVLMAMVILLVGIWTLAVSFPKLLGVVATQEKRTEMARQAERTLSQLTRYPLDLPLSIRGDSLLLYDADLTRGPADIDATGQPEDPTISDPVTSDNANARDDMIEVIGERFTVPAPLAFPYGSYPVYVFRQGLSAPGSVQVYEERDLPGSFSVDPDGTIAFGTALLVEINYDWVESGAGGKTHHVYREVIAAPNPVAAQFMGNFGQVVSLDRPGSQELFELNVLPGGGSPGIDEVIEHPSGAMLRFNANRAGDRMRVNYTLLTEPERGGRRALIMSEEHRIVSIPQTITLVSSHIDALALPVDLDADTLYNDTNILAVDLNTGYVYSEGFGLDWLGEDAPSKGEITVGASPPAPEIGHDVRFYYVTLDQDMISVQIAPATFVDEDIAIALADPSLLYRSYQDVLNGAYTDLVFYPCNAGHTVTVNYKWDNGSTIITVDHEMHTIGTEPGNEYVTLNWPNVTEIGEVKGQSLQAIAWWRAPNGRLIRLDIARLRR